MNKWHKFLEQKNIDSSQIEQIYDKSKLAIELVNQYNPKILDNISTIANLASGVYGIYNSGENKKVLPPDLEKRLIYWGKVDKNNIGNIPEVTIRKYFPDVQANAIKKSDTIHVNINRILGEKNTEIEIVFEIASTIVHEAVHELERETTGVASEIGPKNAENAFKQWFESNMKTILQKNPDLGMPNRRKSIR